MEIDRQLAAARPSQQPHSQLRPLLLTREQAAEALGISVRHLSNQGIPTVYIGRSVRYRPADLVKWIDEQAKATTTASLS